MKKIPISPHADRSLSAFMAFLSDCRKEAQSDGEARLVSVSLEADHLDPLAVLESIYEPDDLHFYLEQPSRRIALAGAEAVLRRDFQGPHRFREAQDFMTATFARTIAAGDLSGPLAGPRFFCSFSFFDDSDADAPFAPATIFVPRWQVARLGDRFCAVANCLVEPDSRLEAVAERIWRAHGKFQTFSYSKVDTSSERASCSEPVLDPKGLDPVEVGPDGRFRDSVIAALEDIEGDAYRKVVLARAVDVCTGTDLHPLAALNRLRVAYPDCYSFSVANGGGQSFIGATPERLVQVAGRSLQTEALAGSTRRGETAVEDAILARSLLQSDKDVREQRLVLDSILRRLIRLGVQTPDTSRLGLLQLSNVQHLHTSVRAELPDDLDLLHLVEELHPTPAVGGTPRSAACARIRDREPFTRGLYAGPLGWVDADGDGEFVVAIRSALIDGSRARVYAGAGIVAGSDADREYAETELKLQALLDNLIGS